MPAPQPSRLRPGATFPGSADGPRQSARPLLWGGPVQIWDWSCGCGRGGFGSDESAPTFELSIPRRGIFLKRVGARRAVADPTSAMVFRPGVEYRVAHPGESGDECTIVAMAGNVAREVWDDSMRSVDGPLSIPLSADAAVTHGEMLRSALRGDAVGAEESALALLGAIAELAGKAARTHERLDQERLAAVLARMNDDHSARLTLASLAEVARCSIYQLCRGFRAATGTSVHRYLVRLRLHTAMSRLADGRTDHNLSALAIDLGFASHAHFTESFRREFGAPPSALRGGVRRRVPRRGR